MITALNNALPPTSKVWVYQSTRQFSDSESNRIREKLKQFVRQWTSHKEGVMGDGDLLFDRFVVLMADESQVGVSGCSMDSSVRFVKDLEHEYLTSFFDRWNIAFVKGNRIVNCNRNDFETRVATGDIDDSTIIFNNLVQTKEEFETRWQIPYMNSWLKNLKVAHTPFSSIL